MGQVAIMRSGILNVRTHPHNEETYEKLLKSLYSLKRAAKLRGDRYAVISLLENLQDESGIMEGVLTSFTRIDENSEWFDLENLEEASGEKVSQISIPANIFPNPKSFYFVFNTKSHRLYIQTYSKGDSLSIRDTEKLFQKLVGSREIAEEFGDVKISMVQSHQSLSTIFGLNKITKIRILIEKPNADVFDDDFEENIEKHLEETRSRQVEIVYSSERGESIKVTPQIRRVSEPALDNGLVEVSGQSATGRETRSTKNHPKIIQDEYDVALQTEKQALRS